MVLKVAHVNFYGLSLWTKVKLPAYLTPKGLNISFPTR